MESFRDPVVETVRREVAVLMRSADPAHDLHHLDRVAAWGTRLAAEVGADASVVAMAAYVHDLDRAGHDAAIAEKVLRACGASGAWPRVHECIERVSDYSFRPPGKKRCSLEAQCLQDADKLDAIGAIGTARAFAFGGAKGRPLWDGKPLLEGRPYDKGSVSANTLQHFPDKLLKLTSDEFNTATAKAEASRRIEFVRRFVETFEEEWYSGAAATRPHP